MLVDEHPAFRLGVRTLLEHDAALSVTADVGSQREAMAYAREPAFDLAIVGELTPVVAGVELTVGLREHWPACKILGLTATEEPIQIAALLRAGASGVALKAQALGEIHEAVTAVSQGTRYLPPSVSVERIDQLLAHDANRRLERLTTREREVFELLVAGHSNESIASKLFIARRTVETHRQHITRKLEVHSLLELVRLAVRHGITRI
ncbi:MAG: response regulator transcription factor [Deltaproteobacteria bacterium]|nr:response regulator transcription factor [Deltaproteobacteria bacterium]MDQ3297096.1 response regulator transcription factor [Myxococcota bacterium]